ncbi:MAG: hypothetical protein ACJ72D_30415, partial [Marmoricola sp.]
TARAALAVKAQQGFVPSLDAADDPKSAGGTATGGTGSAVPDGVGAPGTGGRTATATAGVPTTTVPYRTVGQHSALGRIGLPAILLLGLVLGLTGLALQFGSSLNTAAGATVRVLTARAARGSTGTRRKS